MTDLLHPAPKDMRIPESEKITLSDELHHISELLEEMITLLKDSTTHNKEIISAELSPKDSEVMTVKEAAAMMRISLPKMYEFARSGKIHTLSVGRRILVSRSSIMALLREGEHNGE